MNRHLIYGNIKYNMLCDEPCWDISSHGCELLLHEGFYPEHNPWVKDCWGEYLLRHGYLKCISTPSVESQYD